MTFTGDTSNLRMKAYIVLLHLCSQKWMYYDDLIKLFQWKSRQPNHATGIFGYLNHRLKRLGDEWEEGIPIINALAFLKNGNCTDYIRDNVFGGKQPSPQEVAKYAAAIASYDKWDEVLEVFREEAFREE